MAPRKPYPDIVAPEIAEDYRRLFQFETILADLKS